MAAIKKKKTIIKNKKTLTLDNLQQDLNKLVESNGLQLEDLLKKYSKADIDLSIQLDYILYRLFHFSISLVQNFGAPEEVIDEIYTKVWTDKEDCECETCTALREKFGQNQIDTLEVDKKDLN